MGLFDNTATRLREQAMDACWYKQNVISHNISNVATPGYKAKTVNFGVILKEKRRGGLFADDDRPTLNVTVTTGYEPFTNQTLDENNVDIEKEQLALNDVKYQYAALIDHMNNSYAMTRSALSR
jgi:flagellar basal-body rod protein FlgB